MSAPTLAEIHADDVVRGAIRVNDARWEGRYCVLRPCPDVVGRWITIRTFKSKAQAIAFAAGYCERRDETTRP